MGVSNAKKKVNVSFFFVEQTRTVILKNGGTTMRQKDAMLWVVIVVVIAAAGLWAGQKGLFSTTDSGAATGNGLAPPAAGVSCPDTQLTSFSPTTRNILNTTAADTYAAGLRVYRVVDGKENFVNTVNGGASLNLDCAPAGLTYRVRAISTDLAAGNSSKLLSVIDSNVPYKLSSDGTYIEFIAAGGRVDMQIGTKRHSTLQFRVYDNINKGLMFDTNDADATAFEVAGTNFTGSVDNATATAVGAGGQLDFSVEVQAVLPAADFCDTGCIVLIDAASATWDLPTARYGGQALSKHNFDEFENRLFGATYEYAFDLNGVVLDDVIKSISIYMKALSGVNPVGSDSPVIAFVSVGGSPQTSLTGMRYSSATDAASPVNTYLRQTVNISVS